MKIKTIDCYWCRRLGNIVYQELRHVYFIQTEILSKFVKNKYIFVLFFCFLLHRLAVLKDQL